MVSWARPLNRFNVFLTLAALAGIVAVSQPAHAREVRYASLIIDAKTGEVLHSVNPNQRNYPASLTKLMTLYLVFDELKHKRLKLNDRITFTDNAEAQAPSKLGLRSGQSLTVEQAIQAIVTRSANDVTVAVAEHIGGSEEDFARLMTAKARALGMSRSTFVNASGLPDPEQLSTAHDMATLAQVLIRQFPEYYGYFQTKKFRFNGQTIFTHNRLLQTYKGAEGLKTGYIRASGFNLVAVAKRSERRLIGVVFGGQTASQRDRQMAQLLDKGFNTRFGQRRLEQMGDDDATDANDDAESLPRTPYDLAEAEPQAAQPPQVRHTISMPAARPNEDVRLATASASQGILTVSKQAKPNNRIEEANRQPAWGIQVGAFSRYATAHSAASDALRKLAKNIPAGRAVVTSHRARGQTVYRARLIGITEQQARSACQKLDASTRAACHVVSPEDPLGSTQQASG
ncbi:D-alanyl-D-alanine carboxypeptidase [Rhodospirillaceae bacterium LM-1]|nr:D-alanyl-D-alanine carboxypeptidase [Rhodospirillaceae bacterium LM-1]